MILEIDSTITSQPNVETTTSDARTDISQMLKQGISAAQSGDRPMARTLLLNVTEADPTNVDAWLWLASISEYPEELLAFLNKVLDIEPENERALTWEAATCSLLAKTHVQRGVIANSEGQPEFAMECFDTAIETDERCETAWFWKGSLLTVEGEKLECFERVLSLNPENADAVAAVAAIQQERVSAKMHSIKLAATVGEFDVANQALSEILASEPENNEAWVLRAHLVNSFAEKLDTYDRILQIDPSNAFARYGYDFLSEVAESLMVPEITEPVLEEVQESVAEYVSNDADFEENEVVAETNVENDWNEEQSQVTDEPVAEYPYEENDAPEQSVPANQPSEQLDEYKQPAEELNAELAAFVSNDLNDVATRETIDSRSPFDEVAQYEPASAVAEEAAAEAEFYASPYAETKEFHSAEHEISEIRVDDEDDMSIHETVTAPFQYEADMSASTAWSQPEETAVHKEATEFIEYLLPPVAETANEKSVATCPYCTTEIDPQAFSCGHCHSILSLSDIELLLGNTYADQEILQEAVAKMEADWNTREFNANELKTLGIGHFNLKNYDLGVAYIQESSRHTPNDVILSGQLNAIAIRLDEMRRQDEHTEALPKGKTILVVDDSATVRKLISNKLEKSGHQVVCAVDGVEAMASIETFVPDLVLLDIAMPRMDGYQVCKLIRANDAAKNVPVVMISGKDGFFDKVRGRMAGTTGYITKPFGPETLMKALETYLVPENGVSE